MTDFKNFLLSVKHVQWLDIHKLFSWSYLSDSTVATDSSLLALLFFFFLTLIIAGFIASLIIGRMQQDLPILYKIRGHISNLTLWTGLIGLFLVMARYQAIATFSSRAFLIIDLLVIVVWFAWIIYYVILILPHEKHDYYKRKKFEQYLPKPKQSKKTATK